MSSAPPSLPPISKKERPTGGSESGTASRMPPKQRRAGFQVVTRTGDAVRHGTVKGRFDTRTIQVQVRDGRNGFRLCLLGADAPMMPNAGAGKGLI